MQEKKITVIETKRIPESVDWMNQEANRGESGVKVSGDVLKSQETTVKQDWRGLFHKERTQKKLHYFPAEKAKG